MPGWLVRLDGHDFDLESWRQALRPPFDPRCERVEREEVIWALRSHGFEDLATAIQVKEAALPLIDRLNGALSVSAHAEPVHFRAVGRVDDRGEVRFVVLLEGAATMGARASLSAVAEVRDADGNLVPPVPPMPSAAQRWMELAGREDDVADMFVFAGRTGNWFDIYKAIELAERLTGGQHELLKLLGASARAFKNMRRTANFYRHARGDEPDVPTTLAEAKPLLRSVVRTVLDRRTGGPPIPGRTPVMPRAGRNGGLRDTCRTRSQPARRLAPASWRSC